MVLCLGWTNCLFDLALALLSRIFDSQTQRLTKVGRCVKLSIVTIEVNQTKPDFGGSKPASAVRSSQVDFIGALAIPHFLSLRQYVKVLCIWRTVWQ